MPDDLKAKAMQSRDAIALLADKWRIPILHVLTVGRLRSGQVQRALPHVSSKVLTQTLRNMERDGLISRTVFPIVPAHVVYQLTSMGKSLIKPLRELCLWAERHVEARDRARREFDARQGNANM